MQFHNRFPLVLSLACICLLAQVGRADEASKPAERGKPSKFLRVVKDKKGLVTAMETSIVRFEPREGNKGLSVDLVSAVHIGDKEYFEKLNKAFNDYDVVLYELVAPEGTRVPKGGGPGDHPVAKMQQGMKDLLELEYQLAEIDYTRDNFVHADMSPEQFAKTMSDRGESFLGMLFKAMGQSLAQQSEAKPSADLELFSALFDTNRALKLKRILAVQFQDLEKSVLIFNGPEGSTIITERNKAALRVLEKQIDAGQKKIALYYGGGHMPDMAERLEREFNLKPVSERWITAWDMSPKR